MAKFIKALSLLLLFFMVTAGQLYAQAAAKSDLIVDCAASLNLEDKPINEVAPDDGAKSSLCEDLARIANGSNIVPVSPAFTVLNVTPNKVIRPRTPNDFATSVLNNVDPNGNFQQGLALDFNPYLLWAGDRLTLRDYQTDLTERLLARTQISIATTKGREDADKSARLAIGLQLSPWLESDPKLEGSELLTCMGKQLSDALLKMKTPPSRSASDEEQLEHHATLLKAVSLALDDKKNEPYKACREKHRKLEDNSSGWTLGIAPSWSSNDGDLDDLEWNGFSFWSSLSLNLDLKEIPGVKDLTGVKGASSGSFGQAIIHARYTMDEEVANPALVGNFIQQDSLILSGKLRFNGPAGQKSDIVRDMKFSLEGALVDASRDNGVDDTYYQWTADTEFRLPGIADNLSLVISAGTTSNREGKNETFAGASIQWGFTDVSKKNNK